jgi:hypothetical protein
MACSRAGWLRNTEPGFLTGVFGVGAIGLSLIAAAALQLARVDAQSAARAAERLRLAYAADGVVTDAAWTILHMPEEGARTWRVDTPEGGFTVMVEPERRKLSLAEAAGARAHLSLARWLGPDADDVARSIAALDRGEDLPRRAQLLAASASPLWRRCGLSFISAYSRLSDNALLPASTGGGAAAVDRAGEVWRIAVARNEQPILDRLVRFTGDPGAPTAVIDETPAASPEGCAKLFGEKRAGP